MKVIFLKDYIQAGSASWRKGDIKEVSDGYATNFLFAKKIAEPATAQVIAKIQKEAKEHEAKKNKELERLKQLKTDIEKRLFCLKVKVGDKGQFFGSIQEKDVAKNISEKMGISLEKHQIEIGKPIKTLGEHFADIKLAPGILAKVRIQIEALQ